MTSSARWFSTSTTIYLCLCRAETESEIYEVLKFYLSFALFLLCDMVQSTVSQHYFLSVFRKLHFALMQLCMNNFILASLYVQYTSHKACENRCGNWVHGIVIFTDVHRSFHYQVLVFSAAWANIKTYISACCMLMS